MLGASSLGSQASGPLCASQLFVAFGLWAAPPLLLSLLRSAWLALWRGAPKAPEAPLAPAEEEKTLPFAYI